MSSSVRTPPPTVSGMKQTSAVRRTTSISDAAVLVARGDVEEAQFVGAGLVVGDGAFDGVAGVAQVDEIDALDDAAVLDVEAGDDARLKHYSAAFARAGFFKKSQKNPYMRPEQSDDVMSATKNKSEPANFSRTIRHLLGVQARLQKPYATVEGVHLRAVVERIDKGFEIVREAALARALLLENDQISLHF